MNSFSIKGSSGFIKIKIEEVYGYPNETSVFGGYDTRSKLRLKSTGFSVNSILWVSTGDIFNFYKELEATQRDLRGTASFNSYENNLSFKICYNTVGHMSIVGEFRDNCEESNVLKFEILTDQSYLNRSLGKLRQMVEKYGDNTGIACSARG